MRTPRDFDIKFIKGIGPAKAKLLEEELAVELLGVRPGNGPLDEAALEEYTRRTADIIQTFYNGEADYAPQSTDSNIPLSLGIPANTIGTVLGDKAHTREEWVELNSLPMGLKIALSTVLQYAVL